jgi:hypothetical protein
VQWNSTPVIFVVVCKATIDVPFHWNFQIH